MVVAVVGDDGIVFVVLAMVGAFDLLVPVSCTVVGSLKGFRSAKRCITGTQSVYPQKQKLNVSEERKESTEFYERGVTPLFVMKTMFLIR